MPPIKKVILDHASKEGLSLEDIAGTLDCTLREFNKKLDAGSFTDKEITDLKALLNIEDDLLSKRRYCVMLEGDEVKIMQSLKDTFADQLEEYCRKNDLYKSEFGEAMFVSRDSVKGWFSKTAFPGFDRFFDAQVVLQEGHEKIKSAGKAYLEEKKNLLLKKCINYISQRIKQYCTEKGMFVSDFAEGIGVSAGTIYGIETWQPEKETLNPKTYIRIMKALNQDSPDVVDRVLWPLFYPQKLDAIIEAEQKQDMAKLEDKAAAALSDDLDELLKNYNKVSEAGKAELIKKTIMVLGQSLEYFIKAKQESRDALRNACKSDLQKLGDILLRSRQILRNEEAYQEYVKMNKELYGGKQNG